MTKFERHQEVSGAQARQQLANAALLVAYIHGQPGGWYGIASGSIDGFPADYAIVHAIPGNIVPHPIRAFFIDGDEDQSALEELEEIRQAVADEHGYEELPLVATLTDEEIAAAEVKVRDAWGERGNLYGTIGDVPVRSIRGNVEVMETGELNGKTVQPGMLLSEEGNENGFVYSDSEILLWNGSPWERSDQAEWLKELCAGVSDLDFCDWDAVVEAV